MGWMSGERARQAGLLMSLVEYLIQGPKVQGRLCTSYSTGEGPGHGLIPTCLPTEYLAYQRQGKIQMGGMHEVQY